MGLEAWEKDKAKRVKKTYFKGKWKIWDLTNHFVKAICTYIYRISPFCHPCLLVTKRLCRATFEIAVTAGCLIIRSKEMA